MAEKDANAADARVDAEMRLPSVSAAEKDDPDAAVDDDAPSPAPADLPEGGLPGLKALLGAWCMSAASFGVVNSFVRRQTIGRAQMSGCDQHGAATRPATGREPCQCLARRLDPVRAPAGDRSARPMPFRAAHRTGLFVGRAFDRGCLLYLNCTSLIMAPFGIMMLSVRANRADRADRQLSTQLYQVVLSFGLVTGLALGPLYICSCVFSRL